MPPTPPADDRPLADDRPPETITPALTLALAIACGLIVANLYYAQPLTGLIGAAFGLPAAETGVLVTLTQVGYGVGLLFVVPLGDVIENRTLVTVSLGAAAAMLLAMASAPTAGIFLAAALLLGIASTATQVLVPFAAALAAESNRGRVMGALTGGLMLGIMLARPAASLVTYYLGWHAVFELSAAAMIATAAVLAVKMPRHRPRSALSYVGILQSLPRLLRDFPVLRRRATYQAALYATFSLFWTAVPLFLAGPGFGFSQRGIGLFALAGASGVVMAPIAGWIADRGLTRPATAAALLAVLAAFGIAWVGGEVRSASLLVAAAVLIDCGIVTNLVLSQRLIYGPKPDSRGRIGGLFTALFMLGGAAGSAPAAASLVLGGWSLTCSLGAGVAAAALMLYARELVRPSPEKKTGAAQKAG